MNQSSGLDAGAGSVSPFWLTAFLDFAPAEYDAGVAHWRRLTGWQLSAPRGGNGEFASLLPPDGDDYLRVQRLEEGPSRVHLDLHVEDPKAAAAQATLVGAESIMDAGYQVMRSPGGFVFCLVGHRASRLPAVNRWPGGHRAVLDQVCLDLPADRWDEETGFWSRLTGWPVREVAPTFRRIELPANAGSSPSPLKLLLQRRDDADGPARAHLDWATDHRQAEIDRHLAAGSRLVRRYPEWTVMTGPGGTYCITGRRPDR